MYKRGAMIVFTDAIGQKFNGHRFLSKEVKKGDVGKIASRKKNGWLRVSLIGDKAGRVISVRSGDGGMILACSSNGQSEYANIFEVRALVAIATGALKVNSSPAPIEESACVLAPPHLQELFEAREEIARLNRETYSSARLLGDAHRRIEELEDNLQEAQGSLSVTRKELDELKQSLPELGESSDAKSWTETVKNDLDEDWVDSRPSTLYGGFKSEEERQAAAKECEVSYLSNDGVWVETAREGPEQMPM